MIRTVPRLSAVSPQHITAHLHRSFQASLLPFNMKLGMSAALVMLATGAIADNCVDGLYYCTSSIIAKDKTSSDYTGSVAKSIILR